MQADRFFQKSAAKGQGDQQPEACVWQASPVVHQVASGGAGGHQQPEQPCKQCRNVPFIGQPEKPEPGLFGGTNERLDQDIKKYQEGSG